MGRPTRPNRARSIRPWTVIVLALALVTMGAESGAAQVELSAFGGLYVPTATLGEAQRDPATRALTWQHATSSSFGGRLTVWLAERLGVEGTVAYSPSDLQRTDGAFFDELDGHILLATTRGLWRFARSSSIDWHLLGGVGLVSRSGSAYDRFEGTTDAAAVLGIGLRVRLGGHVTLRYDVEDYLYSAELAFRESLGSHFQNDIVISQALSLEF